MTGATTLGFASHEAIKGNFSKGFVKASESDKPLGFEVAFVCENVAAAHAKALKAGAKEVIAPEKKPWGQVCWNKHAVCVKKHRVKFVSHDCAFSQCCQPHHVYRS